MTCQNHHRGIHYYFNPKEDQCNAAHFVENSPSSMSMRAPHVKPRTADCMSATRDVNGLSQHGYKQVKLYGCHIVSETWPPHVKLAK